MTEDDELGAHGHCPADDTGIVVHTDHYVCAECRSAVSVTDFAHRTRVGYDAPTIRCQDCGIPMRRTV